MSVIQPAKGIALDMLACIVGVARVRFETDASLRERANAAVGMRPMPEPNLHWRGRVWRWLLRMVSSEGKAAGANQMGGR